LSLKVENTKSELICDCSYTVLYLFNTLQGVGKTAYSYRKNQNPNKLTSHFRIAHSKFDKR